MQDYEQKIKDYIREQVTLYVQNDQGSGKNQDYTSRN